VRRRGKSDRRPRPRKEEGRDGRTEGKVVKIRRKEEEEVVVHVVAVKVRVDRSIQE
jgi:hypothetical protein